LYKEFEDAKDWSEPEETDESHAVTVVVIDTQMACDAAAAAVFTAATNGVITAGCLPRFAHKQQPKY